MTPNAITYLFKEAHDTFPPLEGKPFDDDLLAIQETLLPLLMVIPYNQLNGLHSLMAILIEAVKYKAKHGAKFPCPACLLLYDKTIVDNATKVICIHAEATHKSLLDDYASYQAAKRGVAKFLCNVINEILVQRPQKCQHLLHKGHSHQHHGPPWCQQWRASYP